MDTAAPVILDASGRPAAVPDVRARYEAAWFSEARSILPRVIQSARKDISGGTRKRLLANSRYLYKNNPLVRAIVERAVTYTIGTGILPEPDSSNPEWNKRAARVISAWSQRPSLTTKHTLGQCQAIMFRGFMVDGDAFALKTYGSSGRPRIQLIEGHEIGDPQKAKAEDQTDGVVFDGQGRPRAYRMPQPGGTVRELAAENVSLLANLERPNQHRGVCLWASAINTAIDLHDILALEKGAVKVHSGETHIVKTKTGEMPTAPIIGRSVHTAAAGMSPEAVLRYYREILGPEAKVLKHDDDYQQLVSQRPSAAWTGFVDFLAELCCLSIGFPPSMVRQLKVGGADTRRDLAIAQRVIEIWQTLVAGVTQEWYEYVIEFEIEDGPLADAPADWRNTAMQFPRAMTVDAGRTSQQDREDTRTGNMTLQENVGQYGGNWRRHLRQLAEEEREVQAIEKEYQLRPGSLSERLYGRQQPANPPPAK